MPVGLPASWPRRLGTVTRRLSPAGRVGDNRHGPILGVADRPASDCFWGIFTCRVVIQRLESADTAVPWYPIRTGGLDPFLRTFDQVLNQENSHGTKCSLFLALKHR